MDINPIFLKDFYKVGHIDQYPSGTDLVFSNFTPRKSRFPGVNYSVFFGLQYFIKRYLNNFFNSFMESDSEEMRVQYHDFMVETLGCGDGNAHHHIKALFELNYLPIAIYALPEGTEVPSGCPALVIYNTHPDFYWLPNMLETLLSCTLWGACTSATMANEYRKLLDKYASETSDIPEFVDYQAHDFSMRGMYGLEAACISGMAHLQYFKGTDCIPALFFNREYYGKKFHTASVPATEHSIMSAGGKESEMETFERLISVTYPTGILSIVSDTWDLWNVVRSTLPKLKDIILNRDGMIVIRPDSGNPVHILCGNTETIEGSYSDCERKGLIECLWDIFGGTINSKSYKQLDSHIGAIYGDSITLDKASEICKKLKDKGFASTNIVLGIGSYTYQYVTRDTLGWAMKATYCEVSGIGRAITKDPITDDGTKKSHSGLLKVIKDSNENFQLLQNCSWEQFYENNNELKLVFKDGKIYG